MRAIARLLAVGVFGVAMLQISAGSAVADGNAPTSPRVGPPICCV